jgi:predicted amidohydrolase YtcJ
VSLADIPRFAQLGVIASMQPTHATSDKPWAEARLGRERLAGAYAWRRFERAGVRLALGSDFPVESPDPRLGLYSAVTEGTVSCVSPCGDTQETVPSAASALRGFTSDAAWAGFMEREVGRLAPGLRADFVLLDADPLATPPERLPKIKVLSTWLDGAPVYSTP